MNRKMIDALPKLLERLSNGEGLHIPTIQKNRNTQTSLSREDEELESFEGFHFGQGF